MLKCRCPTCRAALKIAPEHHGQVVRCPRCQGVFQAPDLQSANPDVVDSEAAPPVAPPAAGAQPPCPVCGERRQGVDGSCLECGYKMPAALEPGRGEPGEGSQAAPPVDPAPEASSGPATRAICGNCQSANPADQKLCGRCGSPLPRPAGSILDRRYRILQPIALGGFGWVYRGEEIKTGLAVAVKEMICLDPANRETVLNFFIREARILESLQALAIVPRWLDFRQDGQSAYLVMEYLQGRNLNQVLEQRGRGIRPQQVVDWAIAIAEMLDHMHRRSPPLIYRDLKPENIMLLDDGTTIKMIDFGTARDVHRTDRRVMGVFTPGYAPPEQERGAAEPRSDLFALAATLFQLLTNRDPQGSRTPPLRSVDPRQPPWLEELIRINLSENPNDRYDSARAVIEDLRRRRVTTQVICPACGHPTPARIPYCGSCAWPMGPESPIPCRKCRQTNRTGSRYCIYCGDPLGPPAAGSPPGMERHGAGPRAATGEESTPGGCRLEASTTARDSTRGADEFVAGAESILDADGRNLG